MWPVYSETIARQIAAIINDLEYETPMLPAASLIGQEALESGGDEASTLMNELFKDSDHAYRFEENEFLLVADRLAELDKVDEACQVLTAFMSHFSKTPEIQQKLDAYCE